MLEDVEYSQLLRLSGMTWLLVAFLVTALLVASDTRHYTNPTQDSDNSGKSSRFDQLMRLLSGFLWENKEGESLKHTPCIIYDEKILTTTTSSTSCIH